MNVLSLHRHLKSLDWQPVEPMAERAGLSCEAEALAMAHLSSFERSWPVGERVCGETDMMVQKGGGKGK